MDHRGVSAGIACGVGAGAAWGFVFLAPQLVPDFSPLQLATGRFLIYGALAGLLLLRRPNLLSRLPPRAYAALFCLGLLGNTLGGIVATSLIVSLIPIVVTAIASRDHGAAPFRRLVPSLLLGFAGAICLAPHQATADPFTPRTLGLLCAAGALAAWSAFAVGNARWLTRLPDITPGDWSLLTGIAAGAQALLLAPFALSGPSHDAAGWTRFAVVCIVLGVVASILGNELWNRMTRKLPLTLAGQMILFETMFALLYGFLWERRAPTRPEALAIASILAAVLSCVAAHTPKDEGSRSRHRETPRSGHKAATGGRDAPRR